MPDSPPEYQRFFAELKRRKVFRVMAVYGVVGFGLLQILDLLLPALLLPEWTYRFVVLLLLLGFPVAIGVTWAFEATGDGIRRQTPADPEELRRIMRAPASRRWPAGLLALAGAGLLLWGAWQMGRTSAVRGGDAEAARVVGADGTTSVVTSIAVLPFADMSPDGDQEYFSDGISEELLNLLAHTPALQVAARTSSFAFKDKDLGIREIGQRLGVEHVLEGSVRKSGDQVRITAQLIRAEDGFHLWSETWDRTLEDIFAIQDEIATDVARQLEVTLLGVAPTEREVDPEAYNLVLQARHLERLFTPESLQSAGDLVHEALAIDSTYADAWVGLARQIFGLARIGAMDLADAERQIVEAVNNALDIDPGNAGAYATLGMLAAFLQNDPVEAARQFKRALELDPVDLDVLASAAHLLRSIGRFREAETVLAHLVERDPVNPSAHAELGILHRLAGRHDESIEAHRRALTLSPSMDRQYYLIAQTLLQKGEPEAALEEIAREPDDEYRVKMTAILNHVLGNAAEHEAAFRELREKWGAVWPSEIAHVYAMKGEADAAFEWLDRAVTENEDGLDQQHALFYYDPIRDDPRWQEFLEKSGTTPEQLDAIEFEVRLPG